MNQDFTTFWKDFFDTRHWPHRELAKVLHVRDDVVSHWVNGDNAISPKHLNQLLESGILSSTEAAKLSSLCLHGLGFSAASLCHIVAVLTEVGVCEVKQSTSSMDGPSQDDPCLLVLSPLAGTNPIFYSELLGSLVTRANRSDYRVLIQSIPGIKEKHSLREYYPHLYNLSGVIAVTCQVEESTWLKECQEANIPIVLIHDNIVSTHLQGRGRVSSLWEDLTGLSDLVHHLIRDHGCKNLCVVIANPHGHSRRQGKVDMIRTTAEINGVMIEEHKHIYTISQYTYAQGLQIGEEIMASGSQVDAVICLNDEVALAVSQVAQRYGQHHLKVTGYGDMPLADHFDITSVDHQVRATAEQAFFEILPTTNPLTDYPHLISVPTTLKRRSSCCRRSAKENLTFKP